MTDPQQQAMPPLPPLDDENIEWPDVESMAHECVQEALCFGLNYDVIHRHMLSVMFRTAGSCRRALAASDPSDQVESLKQSVMFWKAQTEQTTRVHAELRSAQMVIQRMQAGTADEEMIRETLALKGQCTAASAPSREVPENRYPPYGPQDDGEPNPWSATEFPDLTDEERAAAAGGVPMLDDDGRAMIANSHHYTAENIQAVIDDLNAVARGEESVKWHDRDWRTQAAIYARIIQGLFHDVPIAPSPSVAAEERKL